jgi:hypothetical protein
MRVVVGPEVRMVTDNSVNRVIWVMAMPERRGVAVHLAHDDRKITLRQMGSCGLVASATPSRAIRQAAVRATIASTCVPVMAAIRSDA